MSRSYNVVQRSIHMVRNWHKLLRANTRSVGFRFKTNYTKTIINPIIGKETDKSCTVASDVDLFHRSVSREFNYQW